MVPIKKSTESLEVIIKKSWFETFVEVFKVVFRIIMIFLFIVFIAAAMQLDDISFPSLSAKEVTASGFVLGDWIENCTLRLQRINGWADCSQLRRLSISLPIPKCIDPNGPALYRILRKPTL